MWCVAIQRHKTKIDKIRSRGKMRILIIIFVLSVFHFVGSSSFCMDSATRGECINLLCLLCLCCEREKNQAKLSKFKVNVVIFLSHRKQTTISFFSLLFSQQRQLMPIDLLWLFLVLQTWMGASDATNSTGIHESDMSDSTNDARYIERWLPNAVVV